MQLEPGKYYKTYDKRKVFCVGQTQPSGLWVVQCNIKGLLTYPKNGDYAGMNHPLTIVEEWKDPVEFSTTIYLVDFAPSSDTFPRLGFTTADCLGGRKVLGKKIVTIKEGDGL